MLSKFADDCHVTIYSNDCLPNGDYNTFKFQNRTDNDAMIRDGVGFSIKLTPLFVTNRDLLRIHPDGGKVTETERIATIIGTGGFDDMVYAMDKLSSPHDQDIVQTFYSYYQNYDPFFYQKIVSQPEKTEDILGNPSSYDRKIAIPYRAGTIPSSVVQFH